MKTTKLGMLLVLSLSIVAVITGTTGIGLVSPVSAGGHHHDSKKCKDNGDNNCNDTHKTQKIKAKNECNIENKNKDHSSHNDNTNELRCVNEVQNLNNVVELNGSTDGIIIPTRD